MIVVTCGFVLLVTNLRCFFLFIYEFKKLVWVNKAAPEMRNIYILLSIVYNYRMS